jgi:hypothetical protein
MAVGFTTISLTPSADVDTNDTMTFTYASGNASQFAQADEVLIVSGLGNVLEQAADTFTLAYGATSVTVTYKDATSIPAGTQVVLQLPLAEYSQITDNSGGTASNTIAAISATPTQAEVADAIASLAAKVNTLIELSQSRDNIPKFDRN